MKAIFVYDDCQGNTSPAEYIARNIHYGKTRTKIKWSYTDDEDQADIFDGTLKYIQFQKSEIETELEINISIKLIAD